MTKPDLRSLLLKRGITFTDLAEKLGVHKSQVTRWAQRRVPASRVLAVEKASRVSRKLLRPDLYEPLQ